ncbi:glutaredoxin [Massilia sp. Root351]|jgi:glutaredoxin|uniref:glutaredoxin family protein n=1 Tax=Massilia sp. Root351 TaxID=1736522 RepID=UPI00070A0B75|nr:glutaredoxin family protein [Massilia sp. Root351]KQV80111.1 glutaredoxin [Massilia sp. Root351]
MQARFKILARLAAWALLACAGTASAQMYKWKDARGVTHYTDTPPPANAVPLKAFSTAASQPALPAELAAAVQSRPVTLYTTVNCAGCDQGRTLLQARGIPYTEKTVNSVEDHAALKRAGSAGQLPLLLIGRGKQIGFEADTWTTLLSEAGYPAQAMLPAGYGNPAPAPAAPPPAPSAQERALAAAKAAAEQAQRERRLPPINAAPDFRF